MELLKENKIVEIKTDLELVKGIMDHLQDVERDHNNVDTLIEKLNDVKITINNIAREVSKSLNNLNYYKRLIKEVTTETIIRENRES